MMNNLRKKRSHFVIRNSVIIAITLLLTTLAAPLTNSASGVALYHTVTFVENDNSSDPVFATQSANVPTPLTSIVNLNPAFSNVGYTFEDWNTSPDGSGTSYSDGASYPFASSGALYAIWVGIFHTVTFVENDNSSDPVFATQSANVPTALTLLVAMSPTIVNPGYSFLEWNTSPDASGTAYANGANFNFGQSTGLYAIWRILPTVTESFAANGGSGVVASLTNQAGELTTLPLSSGMTNPGYSFTGWNTAANGSGTQYAAGASYTFTASETLYAQWTPDTYSISYAYDGGVVGLATVSYTVGKSALILPSTSNTGFSFVGWFTQPNEGTLVGLAGDAFTPTGAATIYAQWVPNSTRSVTFSANGANGSIAPISGEVGSSITLPAASDLSNTGYAFAGWNTAKDGSGTQFAGGTTYVITGALTLFAQWLLGPTDTISFNANGGSGTVVSIIGAPGSTITLPNQSGLIRAGYKFSDWNTSPNGEGKSYSFGETLKLTSSTVLYAQWSGHKPMILFGAVGTFTKNSSSLSLALKTQINRIATTIKAKKYSTVTLYGYTATTGLASLNMTLSRARAQHVAQFLRLRLTALRVKGVSIRSAGEGAVAGESSSTYSRVEVFGM